MTAVVGFAASVLLFRRGRTQQDADRDRSGESNMATDWETLPDPAEETLADPVEETPNRSEAPTAPQPVFVTAPDLATEPTETSSLSTDAWDQREGSVVFDLDGEQVGRLQSTYFDNDTGTPEWALVSFGSVRLSLRFVPLRNVRSTADGVHLDFSSEQIHTAPDIDADGHVSEEEEDALYAHYALERTGAVNFTRRS